MKSSERLSNDTTQPELACVMGAGGEYAIGFNLGVLDAMQEALSRTGSNFDLAEIPYLGTSAGAMSAGMLATRQGIDRSDDLPMISLSARSRKEDILQKISSELFADREVSNVRTMSVRVGGARHSHVPLLCLEALDSRQHQLSTIAAASSAVPFVFRGVRVGNGRYVDGGTPSKHHPLGSMTNAEYAADAKHLLVTNPCAIPEDLEQSVSFMSKIRRRRHLVKQAKHEMQQWESRNGAGKSVLITPDTSTAELLVGTESTFSRKVGKEAYKRMYDVISGRLEENREDDELCHLIGDIAVASSVEAMAQ